MGKGQERATQINLVLTKRVTSQHPWRIHWNSELGYFIFEILKECPFKVNFYIMFLLTPVSDKLTQEKARWRPSCKRSLICLMSHEGPMCQSAQIWQGASRYQTSTINNWTLYPLPSHPERLTERELVDVTTVFHAFESGVRSGTMHQDWLKEVWKHSIKPIYFSNLTRRWTCWVWIPTSRRWLTSQTTSPGWDDSSHTEWGQKAKMQHLMTRNNVSGTTWSTFPTSAKLCWTGCATQRRRRCLL